MKLTNVLAYPEAFVLAASGNANYRPNPSRIGATSLIDSPMKRRLFIQKYDDIVVDVDDYFNRLLGTGFHDLLERNSPKQAKAERKWEVQMGDLTLVGKADTVEGSEISDYKLMSVWSYVFDKGAAWEKQLNLYRWMAKKAENLDIDKLTIHAFYHDWSFFEAQRNPDYPRNRYAAYDVRIADLDKVEAYINKRLDLHRDPNYQCTDEDKWIKQQTFAVMKTGGNRSLKGSSQNPITFAEAEEYIHKKGLTKDYQSGKIQVVERKCEPKCCLQYCGVRSVCPFAKGLRV
jgi:hypothetical protein